jgi:ribosome-associated heat shock protein Hsp15
VKAGDIITMMLGEQVRVFEVTALPARRGPADEAQGHYRELNLPQAIDAGGS